MLSQKKSFTAEESWKTIWCRIYFFDKWSSALQPEGQWFESKLTQQSLMSPKDNMLPRDTLLTGIWLWTKLRSLHRSTLTTPSLHTVALISKCLHHQRLINALERLLRQRLSSRCEFYWQYCTVLQRDCSMKLVFRAGVKSSQSRENDEQHWDLDWNWLGF